MNEGFIKLYRKMTEWEWYRETNVMALFIHILLLANWEDKQWQGKTIKRGSFITSNEHLALESGLTIQQTRTVIDKLIGTGEINKQTTNKYTLITVNNYNDYQDNQQTNNKPITTTKEYKEVKNKEINNTNLSVGNEDFSEMIKPSFRVAQDWQYLALELIEKLNVPTNKKSSFFKVAKENPDICNRALSYAIDFPNPKIRWNMFFVKYNEIKNGVNKNN
jgi:hypothetical protein